MWMVRPYALSFIIYCKVFTLRCTVVETSGIVVNTCGWVEGEGYQLLLNCIDAFNIDTVLVLGQDRLYSTLNQKYSKKITVVKLTPSGGVVQRSRDLRRKCRMDRIREYFYGRKIPGFSGDSLSPVTSEISFSDLNVYRVIGTSTSFLSIIATLNVFRSLIIP